MYAYNLISRYIGEVKISSNHFANKVRKLSASGETLKFEAKVVETDLKAIEIVADKLGDEGIFTVTIKNKECFVDFKEHFRYTYSTR